MGLFDRIREPVFLKEESCTLQQLAELEELQKKLTKEGADKISQDIKTLNAGILGENNIIYELKNSHMPMIVLHDVYYEYEGLSAQIDFLIITRRRKFVVECKNLFGNIEINSAGDFVRTLYYNGHYQKEGIYSPITQNKRHMELIKAMRSAERTNFLSKTLFEKNFYENYRSVVVLANPKTVLNAKYAKKEIKDQVIRADQLITFIQKVNSESSAVNSSESDMEALAHYFLEKNQVNPVSYMEKYQKYMVMPAEETVDALVNMSEESTEALKDGQLEAKAVPESGDDKLNPEEISENISEKQDGDLPKTSEQMLCPRCGAPMVKRVASKGANAGKEFYGCSRFPKCRGIVNIEESV